MMVWDEKKWFLINRRVHLYTGLFMLPFIFVFGYSGMQFNHAEWVAERSSEYLTLEPADELLRSFPRHADLRAKVLQAVASSSVTAGMQVHRVGYDRALLVRATDGMMDYRFEADVESGHSWLLRLPSFRRPTAFFEGTIDTDTSSVTDLAVVYDQWLARRGVTSLRSRVQGMPKIVADVTRDGHPYRMVIDLQSGTYRLTDAAQRKFSVTTLLSNLHQVHRYPLKGISYQWIWVLLADALGALMMIWSITGIIMWIRMPKLRKWGAVSLASSLILFAIVVVGLWELGF